MALKTTENQQLRGHIGPFFAAYASTLEAQRQRQKTANPQTGTARP
jgi:hypothetical protein